MKQRPQRGFGPGGASRGAQFGVVPLPVWGSPLGGDPQEEEEEEEELAPGPALPDVAWPFPDVASPPAVPESDPEEPDVQPDVQRPPKRCPAPDPAVGSPKRLRLQPAVGSPPDVGGRGPDGQHLAGHTPALGSLPDVKPLPQTSFSHPNLLLGLQGGSSSPDVEAQGPHPDVGSGGGLLLRVDSDTDVEEEEALPAVGPPKTPQVTPGKPQAPDVREGPSNPAVGRGQQLLGGSETDVEEPEAHPDVAGPLRSPQLLVVDSDTDVEEEALPDVGPPPGRGSAWGDPDVEGRRPQPDVGGAQSDLEAEEDLTQDFLHPRMPQRDPDVVLETPNPAVGHLKVHRDPDVEGRRLQPDVGGTQSDLEAEEDLTQDFLHPRMPQTPPRDPDVVLETPNPAVGHLKVHRDPDVGGRRLQPDVGGAQSDLEAEEDLTQDFLCPRTPQTPPRDPDVVLETPDPDVGGLSQASAASSGGRDPDVGGLPARGPLLELGSDTEDEEAQPDVGEAAGGQATSGGPDVAPKTFPQPDVEASDPAVGPKLCPQSYLWLPRASWVVPKHLEGLPDPAVGISDPAVGIPDPAVEAPTPSRPPDVAPRPSPKSHLGTSRVVPKHLEGSPDPAVGSPDPAVRASAPDVEGLTSSRDPKPSPQSHLGTPKPPGLGPQHLEGSPDPAVDTSAPDVGASAPAVRASAPDVEGLTSSRDPKPSPPSHLGTPTPPKDPGLGPQHLEGSPAPAVAPPAPAVTPPQEPPSPTPGSPEPLPGAEDPQEEDFDLHLKPTQDFLAPLGAGWDPEEPTQAFCPPWEEEQEEETPPGPPQPFGVPSVTPNQERTGTAPQGESPAQGGGANLGVAEGAGPSERPGANRVRAAALSSTPVRRSPRLQARRPLEQPITGEGGQAELRPPLEGPIRRRQRGQGEPRPLPNPPINEGRGQAEPAIAERRGLLEPRPLLERPIRRCRSQAEQPIASKCEQTEPRPSREQPVRRGRGQVEPPITGEHDQEDLHPPAKRPIRRGHGQEEQPIASGPHPADPQPPPKRPITRRNAQTAPPTTREHDGEQPHPPTERPITRQLTQAVPRPSRKQPARKGRAQAAPPITEQVEQEMPHPSQDRTITRRRTQAQQPIAEDHPHLQPHPLPPPPIPADPPPAKPHPPPNRPTTRRGPLAAPPIPARPARAQQPTTGEAVVEVTGPKLRPRESLSSAPPKVLFTGVVASGAMQVALRALGGTEATSVLDCSHLVTDRVRRTFKFLCALARGVPIVTPQWLLQSSSCGRVLPPDPFLLRDPSQEGHFGFSLAQALQRARCHPLLQGYEVHVTPSVRPEPQQMEVIVTCSGGTFLGTMPSTYRPRRFVVSCAEDSALWEAAQEAKLPLVSAELLLTGLLRQQLRFQPYLLTPPPPKKPSRDPSP